jgi:germination protein M
VNPRRLGVIAVLVVLLAAVVMFTLYSRRPNGGPADEGAPVEELGEGVQSALLAFASKGAWRMVEERRDIVVQDDPASRAKRIMEELAAGPLGDDADGTIPPGTRVNRVFFDGTGGAFVDFSKELTENHPGGSSGELFTIRSIVRTLALNFPDVERVSILVDGREIESIAGHIDASEPFPVDQYK